jgi:RNA polymerase sigma-32 factor
LPDDSSNAEEQLSDAQTTRLLRKKLQEFRQTLSGKEADIFDNRILAEKPLTLQELGDKYAISRERVRQIQEKMIRNIKKWLKEQIPDFEELYSDFLK